MKELLIILTILLTFTACNGRFIVEEEETPFTTKTYKSCSKCDICSYYDTNKSTYKIGYSCKCKGEREVTYKVTPQIGHYEKEPNVKVTNNKRILISSSSCR